VLRQLCLCRSSLYLPSLSGDIAIGGQLSRGTVRTDIDVLSTWCNHRDLVLSIATSWYVDGIGIIWTRKLSQTVDGSGLVRQRCRNIDLWFIGVRVTAETDVEARHGDKTRTIVFGPGALLSGSGWVIR